MTPSEPGPRHNGLMGWSWGSGAAWRRWETRLATWVGVLLLVVALPVADRVADDALTGLLLVAGFVLVYGFVAGSLLAMADRRRKPQG